MLGDHASRQESTPMEGSSSSAELAPPGHRRLRSLVAWAPIALLLGLVAWTGLRGIDFGYHWDEYEAQIQPVQWSLDERTLLPNYYLYPSVNYGLNLVALFPTLCRDLLEGASAEDLAADLRAATDQPPYLLGLRSIRVLLTTLAPLWVYLSVWLWRRSRLEALVAAGILGLSWEIAYHARWGAPDAVMMQFGALTLLLTVAAARRPEQARWRHLAAVAAALATGTKYPAGLLLVPVLVVSIFASREKRSLRRTAGGVVKVVLIFTAAFLITTPGAVLQPWAFLRALVVESGWYSQGHWGYTIPAGALHLGRMFDYLGLVLLSPFPVIAGLLSLAAAAGAWWVWKESRLLAGVLLLFPAVYVAFFAAQRVMIVRNLLVLAPFMAILAGRGIIETIHRFRRQQGRWALAAMVAAMLALQGAWLIHAAETIHGRSLEDPGADLARYLRSRSGDTFLLSQRVQEEVAKPGEELPANALAGSGNADFVAVYAYEAMPNLEWPANLRTLTVRTFGPLEVNFNYYPTWEGNDRIVLMTFERACSVGVDFVEPWCP
jgi:hypothetical protein